MFAPFTLAQELKKMQQFNKYYPEDMESTFRNRDASTAYTNTQNQWFGPTAQSHIDLINQGQIPNYQANTAHTGAETEGLNFTNKLNNKWQTLEDKKNSIINNAKADVNNMGPSPQSNNYGDTADSWKSMSPEMYDVFYDTNQKMDAAHPSRIANLPTPEEFKKYKASNTYPSISQGLAQQNTPSQNFQVNSFDPNATLDQMANMGLAPQNTPGMSRAPQSFVPVAQNLNSLRQDTQSAAQMPAQMPAQFDSNARLNQINQQQAAIAARLNKNKPVAETPQEKEERDVRTDARKEKGREDLAAKKVNMAEYKKIGEETKTIADAARATKKHLADFVSAYRKAPQLVKGPLGGMLPKGADKNAQEMDRASAEMMVSSSKAAFGNRMALAEFKHMGDVKPNRQMSEETINRIASYVPLAADRAMEQQEFMDKCKENGISATAASVAWSKYDNEKPIYDFTTDKPIEKNIGKWREYLPSKEEENSANSANSGMVTVRAPNGQLGNIPSDKVEAFLSAHPGSVRQ
jgi:hypothetical protein